MRRLILCLLLVGCVPNKLVDSTIREERRLSKEAQEVFNHLDVVLAQVASDTAVVSSQATATLRSTQRVTDQISLLLGGLLGLAGVVGGYLGLRKKEAK